MSAEVVSLADAKKVARPFKPKIVKIEPKDAVDVWRIFQKSCCDEKSHYPRIDEEPPHHMVTQIFHYISQPGFVGFQMKIGKRTIAQLFGQITERSYGSPRVFCHVWNYWVEESFRGKGFMRVLAKEFFAQVKARGCHYWEMDAGDPVAEGLLKYQGIKTQRLYNRVGGKIGG